MLKLKKGNWTTAETNRLRKIPNNSKLKGALEALAIQWGRDYSNLYAKWYYENSKKETIDEEDAMVFTIDTTVTVPTRSDSADVARMKKGLDMVIPNLKVNGGNISISNKLAHSAKRYLETTYNTGRFTITKVREKGKDTGFSRIFRLK